jgi:hypothetical protein
MGTNGLIKKVMSLSDYYIMKPFDPDVVARRIVDVYDYKKNYVCHTQHLKWHLDDTL